MYDAARPGMVAVGGGAMNDILYAPELYATRRPAPTPPEDLAVLRRVLTAPDVIRTGPLDRRVIGAAEIADHLRPGPLDDAAGEVRLAIVEPDLRSEPGLDTAVVVEIANHADRSLPHRDGRGVAVRVATRTIDPDGRADGWAHSPLPCDVPPAGTRIVDAYVRVPTHAGRYVLEVALRNDRGAWPDVVTRGQLDVTTRWGRFGLS